MQKYKKKRKPEKTKRNDLSGKNTLGDNTPLTIQVASWRKRYPVFLFLKRSLLPSLLDFLNAGERKIDRWFGRHRVALADFQDCPETFANVNDREEHRALEARLREQATC